MLFASSDTSRVSIHHMTVHREDQHADDVMEQNCKTDAGDPCDFPEPRGLRPPVRSASCSCCEVSWADLWTSHPGCGRPTLHIPESCAMQDHESKISHAGLSTDPAYESSRTMPSFTPASWAIAAMQDLERSCPFGLERLVSAGANGS